MPTITWVHIPPLGPHRVGFPLPLVHALGRAYNDALEVDAAKKKSKSIIGHIQQEMCHKMQKMAGTNTFSTWAKANT